MSDPLRHYRERRDLDRSPEPPNRPREPSQRPIFVVQQHDASSMHLDLRIGTDGVLASWVVPKGPSTDRGEKRLAVRTEDHPLDHADFEGHIPADDYGGGDVLVRDIGPYGNLTDDDGREVPVAEAIERNQLTVWLGTADRRRNPVSTRPESVLTGRTVDEVASDDGPS